MKFQVQDTWPPISHAVEESFDSLNREESKDCLFNIKTTFRPIPTQRPKRIDQLFFSFPEE